MRSVTSAHLATFDAWRVASSNDACPALIETSRQPPCSSGEHPFFIEGRNRVLTRQINRHGLLIGAAVLAVAFAHPAIAEIPGITVAPLAQLSATIYPRSLAAAPDGTIWFSEEKLTPHSIGFFTPDGRVTKFAVPCDQCDGNGTRLAYIESIAVGPDGNVWFLYSYVNGDGAPLGGMNNFVGRCTPAGQFTSFQVFTIDAFRRFVYGQFGHSAITSGPDGNVWFTENIGGKV